MKKIIGLIIALLFSPAVALAANSFSLSTSSATAMYTALNGSVPIACINSGSNNAMITFDGTTATSTNGVLLLASGGWLNASTAAAGISGIAVGGSTTVTCYPGIQFTFGNMGSSAGTISGSPTITGNLTVQGATILSGTGDAVLSLTQGGHLTSKLGASSLPTVGTGTVTAGGTDNAMEVTGATSPVTVTFATAFGAKPICTCSDETAALGACKVVPNSNGQTAVVTTTGTDSFTLICIGK